MQMLKLGIWSSFVFGIAALGIVLGLLNKPPVWVFSLNFLAFASLSRLISGRLGHLAAMLGPLNGGILYAIFDNAPLLILCMTAIHDDAPGVAQSCILGSVLANLLLVMGWCFFIAGTRHSESSFGIEYASKVSSLMIVASSALIVPSVVSEARCRADPEECKETLGRVSRAVSICLLVLFVTYLHYRLSSHRMIFIASRFEASISLGTMPGLVAGLIQGALLVAGLGLASGCGNFLMKTLDVASSTRFITERTTTFVLLPIVTDGPSRVDAMVAAYRNEMPKALDFAITRSIHVALFVAPALVLFSWTTQSNCPMTLQFPTPETISLFLGTMLLREVCQDGKSDYLEGAMCIIMFFILSFSF
ncbi:Ca2+ transporter [Mariannaea sp. PMI_226]|nr:Ca2+ transporter [Mariannaea sp. PMI_226]